MPSFRYVPLQLILPVMLTKIRTYKDKNNIGPFFDFSIFLFETQLTYVAQDLSKLNTMISMINFF